MRHVDHGIRQETRHQRHQRREKLRGEVTLSALELIKTTHMFCIDFREYFFVAIDDLPEQIHSRRKRRP